MLTRWKAFKIKAWNWCLNSGSIVWARLQVVLGLLLAGLVAAFTTQDWTALASMDSKAAFKILLGAAISGVITEVVRRKGTVVETTVVANEATGYVPTEVKRLERVEPVPPPQG